MAEIAKTVGQFLERPVLDKTGLSGRFTFELHFTPLPRVMPAPDAPPDPPADPNTVSIFTAVQEQLGLKLEPSAARSRCSSSTGPSGRRRTDASAIPIT